MADIKSWNVSAASNNSAPPDGWPESQAANTVNNCAREMMAALKRWRDDISAVTTAGGSSNAFTLAAAQTITSYAAGDVFVFKANHAITGASTLNVDSVGAKAIRKNYSQALEQGDVVSGQVLVVAYDASNDWFQLISPVCDGAWTTRSFSAGNFTANGSMTWAVASGDVQTDAHRIQGKTMGYSFSILTSTVGGTADTALQITIPASKTAQKSMFFTGYAEDAGGTKEPVVIFTTAGSTLIKIVRMGGSNWTLSADNTAVGGTIEFEIS